MEKQLGIIFCDLSNKHGLKENYDKAVKYALLAIEKGNYGGAYQLGKYYALNGDYENGTKYHTMAIEKNNDADSINQMGIYYYEKADYDTAIKYWLMGLKETTLINNLGICYYYHKNDQESGVKYWLMAIEYGDYDSAYRLGFYYMEMQDYDKGEKYYLLDIEKNNNIDTFSILGCHYYNVKDDHENAMKYFLMGVEKDDHHCMRNMGIYYRNMGEYENAIAYLLMAVHHDDTNAKFHMGICYKMMGDYDQMEKYLLMAMDDGCTDSIKPMVDHYQCRHMNFKLLKLYINHQNSYERYKIIECFNCVANGKLLPDEKNEFLNLITTFEFNDNDKLNTGLELLKNMANDKLTLMDLHFKYSIRGKGYNDAKKDFFERCLL